MFYTRFILIDVTIGVRRISLLNIAQCYLVKKMAHKIAYACFVSIMKRISFNVVRDAPLTKLSVAVHKLVIVFFGTVFRREL